MKEKKSEAPRRGNEELFKWNGNPTFGQILPLAAQHVLAAVVGCVYTGNSGCKMQRIMQAEM